MTETITFTVGEDTTTVLSDAPVEPITLDEDDSAPQFSENNPDIYVIDKEGPAGPKGPPGPIGPVGPLGPVGPVGPTGLSGTATSYRFVQMLPATRWNVTHTLAKAYPIVTVILSDGSRVEADVGFVDASHLTISFSAAVSGEANLT